MMIRTFAAAVGLSVAASASMAQGDLLYDIDFSEPFHTFGATAVIDSSGVPREGFSEYPFTDPGDEPIVDGVFDLRTMTDGVGLIDTDAQARMNLEGGSFPIPGANYDIYTLEFQTVLLPGARLTVFFDTTLINRFTFGEDFPADGAGQITYDVFEDEVDLAEFTFGELLVVVVDFNRVNQRWRITVDGEVLYQGPTQNVVDEVRNIRFSADDGVYFDNIKVWGSFEECGSADLNDDGILDLSDVTTFVESFLAGCQ